MLWDQSIQQVFHDILKLHSLMQCLMTPWPTQSTHLWISGSPNLIDDNNINASNPLCVFTEVNITAGEHTIVRLILHSWSLHMACIPCKRARRRGQLLSESIPTTVPRNESRPSSNTHQTPSYTMNQDPQASTLASINSLFGGPDSDINDQGKRASSLDSDSPRLPSPVFSDMRPRQGTKSLLRTLVLFPPERRIPKNAVATVWRALWPGAKDFESVLSRAVCSSVVHTHLCQWPLGSGTIHLEAFVTACFSGSCTVCCSVLGTACFSGLGSVCVTALIPTRW